MLNALEPGTKLAIHRHTKSSETVVCLEGCFDEVFYEAEFKALGAEVTVTTVDGSYGTKGFVTDAIREGASYYYSCGPMPMLRAVYKALPVPGEMSFEERMGCGFGACMGCSMETKSGPKRVCKEGPVFRTEELLW